MMTTGSVRGKCCALQTSHSRRQPAAASRVGAPQLAQKPWRACQERIALAWPSMASARAPTSPCTAIERRSIESEVVAAGDDQLRAGRGSRRCRRRRCSTAPSGSSAANTGAPAASIPSSASNRAPPRRSISASGKNGANGGSPRGRIGMSRAISTALASGRARSAATKAGVVAPLRDAVERRAVEAERRSARRGLEKGVIHASSLDPAGAGQAPQSRF